MLRVKNAAHVLQIESVHQPKQIIQVVCCYALQSGHIKCISARLDIVHKTSTISTAG